jgi:hypothetical protein
MLPLAAGFLLGVTVPVPRFDKPDVPYDDEEEEDPTVTWRRMQLIRLGFTVAQAVTLSGQADIVTRARRVLFRGATHIQAYRILK